MNKTTYLIAGIVILLVALGSIVFFAFTGTSTPSPFGGGTLPDTNPFGGPVTSFPTNGTNHPPSTAEPDIAIAGKSGQLQVRDFQKDADVVSAMPAGKQGIQADTYLVLGSMPYEPVAATTTATSSPALPDALSHGYEIQYFPEEQSFSIFIYKEPIGDVRKAMASDLADRLGISLSDLCNLYAIVRIAPIANTHYAGGNVGFPQCPGATLFPGD
jgi:hypothetical protein